MLAADDLRIAEETVRDLHARGLEDQARALEALLAVAASALAGELPSGPRAFLTTRQVAQALGVRRETVDAWIQTGQLDATQLGGQVLVRRETLLDHLARMGPGEGAEVGDEARRQHRAVLSSLSPDRLARLEELHRKTEDGDRLSRAERVEILALERELTAAATTRLEQSVGRPGRGIR